MHWTALSPKNVEMTDRIGHFFLLIYHEPAFSSNLLQFAQNKITQTLLNNNLYKIKYIYYTDFGSA